MGALGRSPLARFGRRAEIALRGVGLIYRQSGNARIEALMAFLAISAALAEGGAWRLGLVVVASASVLAAEGLNTAVEFAVDRIGTQPHPLAAYAKDTAAGAVLLAALGAAALATFALAPDVGACWRAFEEASPVAATAWCLGCGALLVAVLRPEPQAAKGRGRGRRTG